MLKHPNYVYGPKDVLIPANIHFGEFILDKLLQHGDIIALINGSTGESVTYKQIAQEAMNLAVSIKQLGIKKGQAIAIMSENRLEFWSAAVGIICTGAILTTINVTYTGHELKHALSISKPKYIFCSQQIYNTHRQNIKDFNFIKKVIVFGDEVTKPALLYKELITKAINSDDFICTEVQGQTDTMLIMYSSGTTGLPKGVMLTHHNALMGCNTSGKDIDMPITALTIAPWFHALGLMGTFNGLIGGRTLVYLPRFEEKLYLETIQKYKVNVITVVPPIAVLLSKSKLLDSYDLSTLFYMFCGAAPLDPETISEIQKRIPNLQPVIQGYGLTECVLAITRDSELAPRPGSVGQVVAPSCIIKVVDTETRESLGPNKPGEICVKGPIVMKGYVGKERKDDFDEDGFFKTGDIGYYDDDKYFFIVDRLKELIKYKAYQVPPAEIEGQLLQHPGVQDAGVVGIPNKEAGEIPIAFVVKKPSSNITEKEIIDYIASKLSNPKHLRGGVKFVDVIPKNPSGKILRRNLRDMLKANKSKL